MSGQLLATRGEMEGAMRRLGPPDRAQEAWRYVNTDLIQRAGEVTGVKNAPLVLQKMGQGVSLQPLESLDAAEQKTILEAMAKQSGADYYAALNLARTAQVQVLKVARGTVMTDPLMLQAGNVAHQRLYIHISPGAQARIGLCQVAPTSPSLLTCETTIAVEANASLEMAVHKSAGHPEGVLLSGHAIQQQRDSRVKLVVTASGSGLTRQRIQSALYGENAEISLVGGADLSGTAALHTHITLHHAVPHCRSRQLFKNILRDASRSSFDGTVVVEKHAQKTVAEQLNNNLLLSADARAATKPRLNIHADDVVCTHGATVGQLEEDEVFYLQARGLEPQLARTLLAYGFMREIVQEMPFARMREEWDRELSGDSA